MAKGKLAARQKPGLKIITCTCGERLVWVQLRGKKKKMALHCENCGYILEGSK